MNRLVRQLSDACGEHLLQEKWLIGPSRRVAHQWLDQVTRGGGRVINMRVKTVRSLAIEVLAEDLADSRLKVARPAARRLLVAEAWDRAVRADGYLGRTDRSARLLALAERAIGDLRQAGIAAADLTAERFEHAVKAGELKSLLEHYEKLLADRGLIDHADALRLAAARLRDAPRGDRIVLVPDDLQWTVAEQGLIDALGPEGVLRLQVDRADGEDPPLRRETTRIVAAVGEANEVRRTFRDLLAGESIPALDDVEILYTASDPYVPLLLETAQRVFGFEGEGDLGVPVTFADGVPARLSRPGRLLTAWLSWIHEDFPQSTLIRMLQAGLLRFPTGDGGAPVSPTRLVRALRAARVGFRRDRYVRCARGHVEALGAQLQGAGNERDRNRIEAGLRDAQALAGLVEALIAVSPEPGADAAGVVSAAVKLLGDLGWAGNALDRLARRHLLDELDGMADALAAAGDAAVPGFDVWEWLAELAQVRVGGSVPQPGRVHAAPLRAGGHSGRAHTIILGLDDGRFPFGGIQDPLLLDGERSRLSSELPTAGSRLAAQLNEFQMLLCRLGGSLRLSFSSTDVADGSEMFASPVVLSAYREIAGVPDGDHTALVEWLGPPASFAPRETDAALDLADWWQCHGADASAGNLRDMVETAFPHLRRGREAAAARASNTFTIWDGAVTQPAASLDPRHPEGPVLAATSSLGVLGRCPLAYFQKYVLRIAPPDEAEPDPRRWLTPMDFGTLMHDVLYEFVDLLIREGTWPPEAARDHPRIAAIVGDKARAMRRRVPAHSEEAYERQHDELARAAEIFVNEQAVQAGRGRPVYLEAAFGMAPAARGTEIDEPDPVELQLRPGVSIRARARVDRVDRLEGDRLVPTFAIWDYKSGSYVKSFDPPDVYGRGRLLQHVLYIAVTQSVLRSHFGRDAVVDRFTFLFPGARTHGRPVMFSAGIVDEGLEIIDRLCALPAAGAFPATDDVEDCRFCDYRGACRAVSRDLEDLCAASARKLRNRDNAALTPFVELRLDD